MRKKLTPMQERFVDEYLKDPCASRAAVKAGYSCGDHPDATGNSVRKHPAVDAAIRARMEERSERVKIDQDYVLEGLVRLADRCMQDVRPVMSGNGEQQVDDDGNAVFRFDAAGAARAFELIGKHLGMFRDKLDVKADIISNEQCDAAVKAFLLGKKE